MKVGFAKRCINPDLPVCLSGFAGERKAERTLDDLHVRVVVYQNGKECYGVFSYDLVAIDDLIIDAVKEGIKKQNFKDEHFLFAATHTHSGPGGGVETTKGILKPAADIFVKTEPKIVDRIVQQSLLALQEALDSCLPSTIKYARSTLPHVGDNRNSLDFAGNNDLVAIFIEQEQGQKAVLVNFACHPTIMNGANKKVSADFPGAIDHCMKLHGFAMSMYLNGSCGDISTRFSRKSCEESEVLRYGKLFEEKLLAMYENASIKDIQNFTIVHKSFTMNMKKADSVDHAQDELHACEKKVADAKANGIEGSQLRVIESYKEGAEANLRLALHPYAMSTYDVNLSFVKINGHVFVCVPGELFSELSNPIQNEHVNFIGYANGYLGYFADAYAYDNFYYEALSSPFEKGQSEAMMNFIDIEVSTLLGKES